MTTHRDRYPIRVGALLWPQQTDWAQMSEYARLADDVGLDSLWTWDHLHAIVGDPLQPIFEGWTTLAAWAAETKRIELGLMVGANTFRNPGLTAKSAVTVDHISDGPHLAGPGRRLVRVRAHRRTASTSVAASASASTGSTRPSAGITRVLAGETVTSEPGGRYDFKDLEHHPLPYRGAGALPLMIGGVGEKKTLRTVARYAQGWNAGGSVETLSHKVDVLQRHCEAVGRDPLEIEFTTNRFLVLRDDADEAARVLRGWPRQQRQQPRHRPRDRLPRHRGAGRGAVAALPRARLHPRRSSISPRPSTARRWSACRGCVSWWPRAARWPADRWRWPCAGLRRAYADRGDGGP